MDLASNPALLFGGELTHPMLGFSVSQLASRVLDQDAERMSQRKWRQDPTSASSLVLNPLYPLTDDEKDVLRFMSMVRLLGSVDNVRKYYDDDLGVSRVLTSYETAMLEKNRPLYERFKHQPVGVAGILSFPDGSLAEVHSLAKAWLEAHGVVPNPDPQAAVAQYHSMITCSVDDRNAGFFDRENVSKTVAAQGRPLKGHTENVREMCRNMLHDNPHRPIAPSDFHSAVFTFESSDREHEAFMQGVGAMRPDFVTLSDLESQARQLGLPLVGSKRDIARTVHRHVRSRLSRKFLLAWLRHFDFHLFAQEEQTGRRVPVNPDTLPKRLLMALLGQFASGDVVCSRNPGLALSLTPLSHMLEHFRAKGVSVAQAEQQDVFSLFPRYCLDKRARKGVRAPQVVAHLRAQEDSPMAVIDALLEEGVYATNALTPEEQARVAQTLGMSNSSGAAFEAELKRKLEPYLRDFNGVFLKLWLEEHNPEETVALGVDNMLAHYVTLNLCSKGWRSSSLKPDLPQSDSAAVQDVLHTATVLAAAIPGEAERPEVKANEPALVEACAAVTLQPEDEQKTVATVLASAASQDKSETKRAPTRNDKVQAASCLLDMLYMKLNPETDKGKVSWLVDRIEAVLRLLDQEPSAGQVEARYLDYMLWMESLASIALLRRMFEIRAVELPAHPSKRQLLDLLSESNLERMWIVERWAKEQHKGTLCFHTPQDLQRKLDVLKVNSDKMSYTQKKFLFVNMLHIYLHDEVVLKFLTEKDQRALLLERKEVNFNTCYETYCQRMGSEENAVVAGAYNGKLAFRFIIKHTSRSKPVNTPECAAGTAAPQVTAATRKVILEVPNSMETLRMLHKDPVTGVVNEYSVSNEEGAVFVQTFTGSDADLASLTAYYLSRHDKLVSVDDGPEAQAQASRS